MAARKNYSFEKNQRAKAKAAKREEKAAARAAKKQKSGADEPEGDAGEGQRNAAD